MMDHIGAYTDACCCRTKGDVQASKAGPWKVLRLLPEGDVPKSVRIRDLALGEGQPGQAE